MHAYVYFPEVIVMFHPPPSNSHHQAYYSFSRVSLEILPYFHRSRTPPPPLKPKFGQFHQKSSHTLLKFGEIQIVPLITKNFRYQKWRYWTLYTEALYRFSYLHLRYQRNVWWPDTWIFFASDVIIIQPETLTQQRRQVYQATRENTELRQTLRGFATERGHVGEMVVTPLRLVPGCKHVILWLFILWSFYLLEPSCGEYFLVIFFQPRNKQTQSRCWDGFLLKKVSFGNSCEPRKKPILLSIILVG